MVDKKKDATSDDFILPDGEGEETRSVARAKPKPIPKPKQGSVADPRGVESEEEESEEDAPLSKRQKPARRDLASAAGTAASTVAVAVPCAAAQRVFAYYEGAMVEVKRGAVWVAARIDNLNAQDGTYDVVYEIGDEEEGMAENRMRPRQAGVSAPSPRRSTPKQPTPKQPTPKQPTPKQPTSLTQQKLVFTKSKADV